MSKHRPAPKPVDPRGADQAERRAAYEELMRRMRAGILDRIEALLETYPEPTPSSGAPKPPTE